MARGKFIERASAPVPAGWRQALALDQPLPERSVGPALFADTAGFSPLTAALKQALGLRRGAEEPPDPSNQVRETGIVLVCLDPMSVQTADPCHPLCRQQARDRLHLPETAERPGHGWGPGYRCLI